MIKKLALGLCLALVGVTQSAVAQVWASDNFESYSATPIGNAGGVGNWSDNWAATGNGGFLEVASPIDGAKSLGIFGTTDATRHFTALSSGVVTVSWSMKSLVDIVTSGTRLGVNILDGSGGVILTMKFDQADPNNTKLQINDGGTDFSRASITFGTGHVYDFSVTLTPGSQNYSFAVTDRSGGTDAGTNFTMSRAAPASIAGITFFSVLPSGSGNDGVLDNVLVAVPEPSTLSLLAAPMILGALFFVRRRRS
jgi:hypothetical protein